MIPSSCVRFEAETCENEARDDHFRPAKNIWCGWNLDLNNRVGLPLFLMDGHIELQEGLEW